FLRNALPSDVTGPEAKWADYEARVLGDSNAEEHPALRSILTNFRLLKSGAEVADFASHLESIHSLLEVRAQTLKEVRRRATRNQDVYLTWDHMDVYFA